MRKGILAAFVAAAALLSAPQPGYAGDRGHGHHRHGGHHWHGHPRVRADIVIGGLFGPWWPRPHYYGYRPQPYVYGPPVIVQEPPVYIQQEPEASDYWYYCTDPQGYYPYISQCRSSWLQVVPPQGPPDED